MKKEANKTLIGAFIVGAIGLAVAGILAFGGGSLFEKSDRYVLYFSGSVKGLGLGAPVQLKGVTLGKVIGINLVYNAADESFLNRVTFEITEGAIKIAGDSPKKESLSQRATMDTTIDKLVKDGLRAKLKIQSFVTGQLLVAFDFYPEAPIHLVGIKDKLRELPTLPSDLEELAKTFDSLAVAGLAETFKNAATGIDTLVNSMDIQKLAANANQTLSGFHRLAANLDRHVTDLSTEAVATLSDARRLIKTTEDQLPPMAQGISGTAADVRKTIAHLDSRIQPAMENIEAAAAAARDAFRQADPLLTNLSYLSSENSILVYHLDETLTESRKAARALGLLADYLNRHPEALLQGKKASGGTP